MSFQRLCEYNADSAYVNCDGGDCHAAFPATACNFNHTFGCTNP